MENDKSYLFATYLSCNSKTKPQIKKKFRSETPSKMTQIIFKNHKNHKKNHSIKKNSTGHGAASYEYIFFQFF